MGCGASCKYALFGKQDAHKRIRESFAQRLVEEELAKLDEPDPPADGSVPVADAGQGNAVLKLKLQRLGETVAASRVLLVKQSTEQGCSVRQLLKFYGHYQDEQKIGPKTPTSVVLRDIILPATKKPPRCYMNSDFMTSDRKLKNPKQRTGMDGAKLARRVVCHDLKSRFLSTVLNILLDAMECSRYFFQDRDNRICTRTFNSVCPGCAECAPEMPWGAHSWLVREGVLDTGQLLHHLSEEILDKSYWICIFAVNQHQPKSGSAATTQNPPPEAVRVEEVAKLVDGVVVSVDREMTSRQVWALAVNSEAMVNQVALRSARGLGPKSLDKLRRYEPVIGPVELCVFPSAEDRIRMLRQIGTREGGCEGYDIFINCLLELSYGLLTSVDRLTGSTLASIARLKILEMDYNWCADSLVTTETFMGNGNAFRAFYYLESLSVTFRGCSYLTDVGSFGRGLLFLANHLQSLEVSFAGCTQLSNVNCLKSMSACLKLRNLFLEFSNSAVGQEGIKDLVAAKNYLGSLKHFRTNFTHYWWFMA